MDTRQLGASDLHITPIGFGAWALGGGGWEFGWGPQDDRESIAAIRRAIDLGINWIDTAAVYGLGRSEEVVARALDGVTPRPYVFTKCSLVWGPDRRVHHDISPSSIRREIEASLRRLRVDVIDLYYLHRWDKRRPIEESVGAVADLVKEGKVKAIGLSEVSAASVSLTSASILNQLIGFPSSSAERSASIATSFLARTFGDIR